jgi:hypothetical protein
LPGEEHGGRVQQQPSGGAQQQYIGLISSRRNATAVAVTATAVLSRTVAAAPGSPLSVPLTHNDENGLIYAGGAGGGIAYGRPCRKGVPLLEARN